jgi:hypothetical protein
VINEQKTVEFNREIPSGNDQRLTVKFECGWVWVRFSESVKSFLSKRQVCLTLTKKDAENLIAAIRAVLPEAK